MRREEATTISPEHWPDRTIGEPNQLIDEIKMINKRDGSIITVRQHYPNLFSI